MATFLGRFLQHHLTFDIRPHAALVYRHRLLLTSVLLVDVEPETVIRAVELGLEVTGPEGTPTIVARDPPDRYPLGRPGVSPPSTVRHRFQTVPCSVIRGRGTRGS
ncbi:hypothetical protein [Methanopyrus sp. KOL6]|uniref:hypothetical protein n=1 Tax=Methanopyrus sp. KOL6 TaxID=1937004 RepID=UPI000B4BFF94|nr:hypothetical protein [Methanopyrus sp. KOL6]